MKNGIKEQIVKLMNDNKKRSIYDIKKELDCSYSIVHNTVKLFLAQKILKEVGLEKSSDNRTKFIVQKR